MAKMFSIVQAGPGSRFADGAFDSMIGRELPITGLPGGDAVGTLTGASVQDNGTAVLLGYEVDEDVARRLQVVDSRDFSMRCTGGTLTFTPRPARPAEPPPMFVACPTCEQAVKVVSWEQPPRETTDDFPSPIDARTFEPGPAADVRLSCGHGVSGVEGALLLRLAGG